MVALTQEHMESEDIASKINTLENLSALYDTSPEPLKSEVLKLIQENIKFANEKNVDIPRTLSKFYVLKD
jgi:hypothetical protein